MEKYLYPIFLVITILLMIAYLYKTHKRWLVTVAIRAVAGIVLILVLNIVLPMVGAAVSVGVNPISVIGSGLLGIPGIILLYGSSYFFSKY